MQTSRAIRRITLLVVGGMGVAVVVTLVLTGDFAWQYVIAAIAVLTLAEYVQRNPQVPRDVLPSQLGRALMLLVWCLALVALAAALWTLYFFVVHWGSLA